MNGRDMGNWVDACSVDDIESDDVIRFDHEGQSFAIYRTEEDEFYCTDGFCSHEQVHLADGLMDGHAIECPKHSGTFDVRTGEALRPPACKDLKPYLTEAKDGRIRIQIG